MPEIGLTKRVKYAGDVHAELLKAGWDLETATLFVNNIPDADVAPVVRCKDCKHRGGLMGRPPFMFYICTCAEGLTGAVRDENYCSYGERKDGDGKC